MTLTVCHLRSFERFLIHGLALPLFNLVANMIWKVPAFGNITALYPMHLDMVLYLIAYNI